LAGDRPVSRAPSELKLQAEYHDMAKQSKPNILILWGDDIGWFNISAHNNGIMGYRTPNIDRIAEEGANFTDWYGQQSCTAGRACFITGQSPIRTGLTKVGLPVDEDIAGIPTKAKTGKLQRRRCDGEARAKQTGFGSRPKLV
jgi:arylsulfatase